MFCPSKKVTKYPNEMIYKFFLLIFRWDQDAIFVIRKLNIVATPVVRQRTYSFEKVTTDDATAGATPSIE